MAIVYTMNTNDPLEQQSSYFKHQENQNQAKCNFENETSTHKIRLILIGFVGYNLIFMLIWDCIAFHFICFRWMKPANHIIIHLIISRDSNPLNSIQCNENGWKNATPTINFIDGIGWVMLDKYMLYKPNILLYNVNFNIIDYYRVCQTNKCEPVLSNWMDSSREI